MAFVWDYDAKTLSASEKGQIKLLERAINYGPGKGKNIKLSEVRKYWDKLNLFPRSRRLFELLIWGKYQSSPKNKDLF
jgi:hypothetical protein